MGDVTHFMKGYIYEWTLDLPLWTFRGRWITRLAPHIVFTVGFCIVFSFKNPNHLRSSQIWLYSALLQMSWDYRAESPMFANGGADCQVPSVGMKLWFYLQKLVFFTLKPKTKCIGRKKLGFFPLLVDRGRGGGRDLAFPGNPHKKNLKLSGSDQKLLPPLRPTIILPLHSWSPLGHITHIECTSSSRSTIQFIWSLSLSK